jgi:hypothetical protein
VRAYTYVCEPDLPGRLEIVVVVYSAIQEYSSSRE